MVASPRPVEKYFSDPNLMVLSKQYRIALAARKGGVGKTTIGCSLASVFAAQHKSVLVIDLDPQSNSAYALGVDPSAPGTAELLMGEQPTPLVANEYLHVFPGGPNLNNQAIQSLHPEELADIIDRLPYEVVILDCPPGNENLERFGIVASNITLVVTNAHPFAIMGASRVLAILDSYRTKERRGPKEWALVLSQIDERRGLDKTLPAELQVMFPDIKHLMVHQDTNLSQAGAQQTPIVEYAPKSKAVEELRSIAQWVCKIIDN
jgi:chromosome partitioning protein